MEKTGFQRRHEDAQLSSLSDDDTGVFVLSLIKINEAAFYLAR